MSGSSPPPPDRLEGLFDHIEVPQAEEESLSRPNASTSDMGCWTMTDPSSCDVLQRHVSGERLLRGQRRLQRGSPCGQTLYLGGVEDLLAASSCPRTHDLARDQGVVPGDV